MSWRPAPSVAAGLKQATERWPKRKKGLDGTIGDANHQARESDHNPDALGVVHAFDLTHDPANGVNCQALAEHLVSRKDARVRKLIFNHKTVESNDWLWRDYTGESPHTGHLHVSIHKTAAAENDTSPWWDVESTNGGIYSLFADPITKMTQVLADALAAPPAPPPPKITPQQAKQASKAASAAAAGAGAALQQAASSVSNWFGGSDRVDPYTGPPLAKGTIRPRPAGWFVARKITPAITARANALLESKHPLGTHIYETVEGRALLFAVEWHKHPPTDPVPDNLKEWHRGISTCEQRAKP